MENKNNKKKTYNTPIVEIIKIHKEEIITTSGFNDKNLLNQDGFNIFGY